MNMPVSLLAAPVLPEPALMAAMAAEPDAESAALALLEGQADWTMGLSLVGERRWPEAARAFGRATRAAPQDALYWVNLANAQRRLGKPQRAVAAARRCLQIDPQEPLALRILGDCLTSLNRPAEAIEAFATLEAAGHEEPDAMLQHAGALQSLHRYGDSARLLLRLLPLKPDLVAAHALLAGACRDQGLKQEAAECLKTVLALEPDNLEALSRLSFEKRHVFDWSDLEKDIERIRRVLLVASPDRPRLMAAFAMLSLPLPPELQLAAARSEALAFTRGITRLPPVSPASRAGRKTRLGWVSFDYRNHPVSQLLVEVLAGIDRERFDVVLYSIGPTDGSPLRARMEALADDFVDLQGLSDPQAAARVRADGIDVLVDLMGHTRGHRMAIFAHRPAPVQVAYLGYPASTGSACLDYLIGDPFVTPPELAGLYTEKLALLPLTLQPNGRGRPLPEPVSRTVVGLPEDAFVMCAFNHPYKVLPEAFEVWCSVMREVPRAVLWLRETNDQLHENVRAEAQARGVDPARILFARTVPYHLHFSRLALADVFVDTWPYNAHTTASDALWAGVPVVTHYGNGYASRVAASVLNAAGIGELAFESVESYRLAILALATDADLLAGYREHLVTQRLSLPLFDTPRYTLELQALLDRMIGRWRAGLEPDHLLPT
jgi:predicted O-linked N-acetylglucosamine transferase (SPINDLY family)